jgi:hypothetical protein
MSRILKKRATISSTGQTDRIAPITLTGTSCTVIGWFVPLDTSGPPSGKT